MRTIKFILFICLFLSNQLVFSQYIETFPFPDKGVTDGPCGATAASCAGNDFTSAIWDINGDFSGLGAGDGAYTTAAGVLLFDDTDGELCWESPVLDVSSVAGAFSFSVDVAWEGHDSEDFIDVEYQIDGGSWIQIANVAGGGIHTVDFGSTGNTGSMTIGQTGLTGTSSLSIRVCVNINLFEPFEFASIDNVSVPEAGVVLPVEWASLKASSNVQGNLVEWTTFSEINNDRFEIEKSIGGNKNFYNIGHIEGAGNSASSNDYSFLDKELGREIAYYRIRQVDYDGNYAYSPIISLAPEKDEDFTISFNPNITSDYTSFTIDGNAEDLAYLEIFNMLGQVIQKVDLHEEGTQFVEINLAPFSKGQYYTRLIRNNGQVVRLRSSSFSKI